MKRLIACFFVVGCLFILRCTKNAPDKRTVLAIPVYGQSVALGEEAIRVTDFDSLYKDTHHLVVTQNLDYEFGYYSDTHFKQWMKKILNDRHRAFELSVYGMSEVVANYLRNKGCRDSLMICTFPGGQGAASIVDLGKGSVGYKKFLAEIKDAYEKAKSKGWNFEIPAFCWMQGEDDVVWGKSLNYKKDLKAFQMDLNRDVKAITKQRCDIVCIIYQTNCLTLSKKYVAGAFYNRETSVPQGQTELIRDDSLFMASGPTYPYTFVDERVHIDGVSQKRLGYLTGLSVVNLLESKPAKGLIPLKVTSSGDTVIVQFNVPNPPLVIDTIEVLKAANYGFSVIDNRNINILKKVILHNDQVKLLCTKSPVGSKVKYAVNGLREKSGYKNGPRGNLRDSQGKIFNVTIQKKVYPLDNWCYQFDELVGLNR